MSDKDGRKRGADGSTPDAKERQHDKKSSDRHAAGSKMKRQHAPLLQTRFRESLAPYLPPPVLKSIHRLDPQLEPYVGPEATVTVAFSLIVSWFVIVFIRFTTRRLTRTGSAIAKSDKDKDALLQEADDDKYDATVLLVGAPDAGKTRLYYQLMQQNEAVISDDNKAATKQQDIPTLTSLRPNVGISSSDRIRYIDWPGISSIAVDHDSDESGAFASIWKSSHRIVLVVDGAQSGMAPAADVLYYLLLEFYKMRHRKKTARNQPQPLIYVACHKQDAPKAKNPKRIQLQLRTELERLLQVNKAAATSSSTAEDSALNKEPILWWPPGEPLELDQLDFCKLYFGGTSCAKAVSDELRRYCMTGELPT